MEIRIHPDKRRGWFENPRFWRTSFVDGPWGHLQRTSGKWGGVVLKFRTFPDGGGGEGVVCESSDVRKFLKKSKFQNFSELFKVKTRNYNRSRFQYENIHILRLQQPRRQQISLIKNRSLKQGSIVRGQLSGV